MHAFLVWGKLAASLCQEPGASEAERRVIQRLSAMLHRNLEAGVVTLCTRSLTARRVWVMLDKYFEFAAAISSEAPLLYKAVTMLPPESQLVLLHPESMTGFEVRISNFVNNGQLCCESVHALTAAKCPWITDEAPPYCMFNWFAWTGSQQVLEIMRHDAGIFASGAPWDIAKCMVLERSMRVVLVDTALPRRAFDRTSEFPWLPPASVQIERQLPWEEVHSMLDRMAAVPLEDRMVVVDEEGIRTNTLRDKNRFGAILKLQVKFQGKQPVATPGMITHETMWAHRRLFFCDIMELYEHGCPFCQAWRDVFVPSPMTQSVLEWLTCVRAAWFEAICMDTFVPSEVPVLQGESVLCCAVCGASYLRESGHEGARQ